MSVRRVATEDGGYPHSREARLGLTQPASHLRTEARVGHSPRLGPDTAVTPRPDDTHPMSGPTPGLTSDQGGGSNVRVTVFPSDQGIACTADIMSLHNQTAHS